MKQIKYIIGACLLLLSAYSCNEEFLEAEPYSFTAPENFYKTAEDAELAITGCYAVMSAQSIQGQGNNPGYSHGLVALLNGNTDELITASKSAPGDYAAAGKGSYTASDVFFRHNWFFFYAGINRINYLLDRIDDIEMESETRKNEIKAEARFLRGFYHLSLAWMFGAIPTYTEPVQEANKARKPLSEVYSLIIEDFEYAYENGSHRSTVTGRANKWTAAGFLAKVYCYLGSCKNNNVGENLNFPLNSFNWVDANDVYSKALQVTNDIIDNSGYVLIDNYDRLFREYAKSYQYQECLLLAEACADINLRVFNVWTGMLIPQGHGTRYAGGWRWLGPASELYYKYSDGDFRRDHNLTGNLWAPAGQTPDEEIVDNYSYFIPRELPGNNPTNAGMFSVGKFRHARPDQRDLPPYTSAGSNPILRYADILLLKAEALYFANNDATGARAVLSELRTRALAADTIDVEMLNAAYFKDDFTEELLEERSRELCFEYQRRLDLIRFDELGETINNMDATVGKYNKITVTEMQINWEPNKIWFPLPLEQISINQELVQNPGY